MIEIRIRCLYLVVFASFFLLSSCASRNSYFSEKELADADGQEVSSVESGQNVESIGSKDDGFSVKQVQAGQEKDNVEKAVLIKNNSDLVKALRFSGADAQATKRGVVINLPDAFFEFDRYVLTPDAIRALTEISRILKGVPGRSFSIEGHTDYIGRVTYNKDLSLKRASSVASELKSKGVTGREMLVRGFGEGYPVATNNSELGRSRNRRVEIVISND